MNWGGEEGPFWRKAFIKLILVINLGIILHIAQKSGARASTL